MVGDWSCMTRMFTPIVMKTMILLMIGLPHGGFFCDFEKADPEVFSKQEGGQGGEGGNLANLGQPRPSRHTYIYIYICFGAVLVILHFIEVPAPKRP